MNKAVLITGAAKGLGLSLCRRFYAAGYTVYALDLKMSDELCALCGKNFKTACCDVSDLENVKAAIDELEIKSLDVVINNAGIWLDKSRRELLAEDFDFDTLIPQFKVNAAGVLNVAKATLPFLLESSGVMINLSSEAGSISASDRRSEYGYCMSKAAQNMATKIMSNTYKEKGVKFYALHPGWMITDQGIAGATGDYYPEQEPNDTADKILRLAENPCLDGLYYDITTGEEMQW